MSPEKAHEGEHVGFGVVHALCELGEAEPEAISNLTPLPGGGGDYLALTFWNMGERVAHKTHAGHAGVVQKICGARIPIQHTIFIEQQFAPHRSVEIR